MSSRKIIDFTLRLSLQKFIGSREFHTIEHSPGETFLKTLEKCHIDGIVSATTIPDLPFSELFASLKLSHLTDRRKLWTFIQRCKSRLQYFSEISLPALCAVPNPILTIACGMKTTRSISTRLEMGYRNGARGFLIVGGGGLLRRTNVSQHLPFIKTTQALKLGRSLLPDDVIFLATWNPNIEGAENDLKVKVDAGAHGIITQPPLLQKTFLQTWRNADSLGLMKDTRMIAGLTTISSLPQLHFWLFLVKAHTIWSFQRKQAPPNPEAQAVLQKFVQAQELRTLNGELWIEEQRSVIQKLPSLSGKHFMPMGREKSMNQMMNSFPEISI